MPVQIENHYLSQRSEMLSIFLFQTIIIHDYSIRFREMLPTKEEDSKSEIKCNITLSDSFLVIPTKTEVSKSHYVLCLCKLTQISLISCWIVHRVEMF